MSGLLMLVAAEVGSGWRAVVLASAGPLAAALLAELALKPLVERRFHGDLAFPSGHATGVTAVAAAAVVIVVAGRVGGRKTQFGTSLVATAAVVAVGTSLVALDEHYATDVVGGVLLAAATVCALALALDRCPDRHRGDVRATAPPQDGIRAGAP
jgi:undecaprenyl-diphosphatase